MACATYPPIQVGYVGRFCWKLVAPLLDKRTREKCKIVGNDVTVIEEELGWEKGELQKMLDSELVDSEEERGLRKLIRAANTTTCECAVKNGSFSSSSLYSGSTTIELENENEAAVL